MAEEIKQVEINCDIRATTDKAYLVYNGSVEAWVPKSLVSDYTEEPDGHISSVFIPEWLAEDKELV